MVRRLAVARRSASAGTFSSNRAPRSTWWARPVADGNVFFTGGGIYNLGETAITNSTITNNVATQKGGGIRNEGLLILDNSVITDNLSGEGGGVFNLGDLFVTDSLFESNSVVYSFYGIGTGGALDNSAGYARFDRSALIRNSTDGDFGSPVAGTIENRGGATLVLSNSTISESDGIALHATSSATLEHTTIAKTDASAAAVVGEIEATESLSFDGVILGENAGAAANCDISILGGDYVHADSYDDDGSCLLDNTLTGLDPVARDNGGPTPTHKLNADSSAVDGAGPCGLSTDQRGIARDPYCDAGSFELNLTTLPTLSITGTCPGSITIAVDGATPESDVYFIASMTPGNLTKSLPPCEGIVVGLLAPSLATIVGANSSGAVTLNPTVTSGQCGLSIQAIDAGTCQPTSVEGIPPTVRR